MDGRIVIDPDSSWYNLITEELSFNSAIWRLCLQSSPSDILPSKENIFKAFKLTPYESVRVVIIGQDPYPQAEVNRNMFLGKTVILPLADGLAFSAYKMTNSLRSIFKAIEQDTGIKCANTSLANWARQGVLLLNSALTVEKDNPGSHIKIWRPFLERVLGHLNYHPKRLIFLLWGNDAQSLSNLISPKHVILKAPHPVAATSDPNKSFVNCKHFSQVNTILTNWGEQIIDWST